MKNYLRTILILAISQFKSLTRNYLYLFFMVALPVMFLTIFGFMNTNNANLKWKVAIFNHAKTESGKKLSENILKPALQSAENEKGFFIRKDTESMADAEEQLVRSEIDAILVFPEDFGRVSPESHKPQGQAEVIYRAGSSENGSVAASVFERFLSEADLKMGREPANLTVKATESKKQGLKRFDFLFSGMLAYTVMMFGLMGLANAVPDDKKTGALKRIHASPVTSAQYLMAYGLAFMAISVVAFGLMILEAIFVFNWQMRGDWLTLFGFMLISLIMLFGTGLIIGGFSKDEQQASGLANAVMFPLMFLSGVFFPRFLMPEFLQSLSDFVPLTPVNDGIRLIITENYGFSQLLPQVGLIVAWMVVLYIIAVKVFRWESN